MPKQTILAEVYSRTFGLDGPGPIFTCRKLTYTYRRDAAGQFRAEFPATDKMLDLVTLKNTYLLFRVGGEPVFRGLVERINRVMDRRGKQLMIITGRDSVLGALAENTVGLLAVNYVYDAPSQILGASNVPNQTIILSSDGYDTTIGSYRRQFAGETALAALIKVASDLGEHFRAPTDGSLEVVWMRQDTPAAPVRLVASGGPRLHENENVAIIEEVESDQNGEKMANRIYPYGAGNGAARLTLQYATNTMPADYSMNTGANYIQNDAQQGLPSVRKAIHKIFNHIGVEDSATYDITVTTTALTGATTIQVESIAIPIASGTLLDLNGAGVDFVELSANVSVGANVLNVVATTFDVLDTDTLRYTNPVALEGAARQLATAALAYLQRVSEPDRMVSYKLTVRGLPDSVHVGMLIPVISQAPGFAIDDDLVILEITRSVDRNGRMPAVLTVVPVDWFDLGEPASIAEALAEVQNYQAQDQPVDYAILANAPTVYTQEEIEDFVAAQFTGNTGLIDATYNDTTGAITLTLDVSAADKILYSTAADTWAETAITAFGRGLIDDADASAARTTLGLGGLATLSAVGSSEITDGSVANADLANMAQATIKGRASGAGTGVPGDLTAAQVAAIVQASIDHGSIAGLTDDDHTGYALLAGRAGGQSLTGGTGANDDITIQGTSNATRTSSYVILQPNGGSVVIGGTTAEAKLHIIDSDPTATPDANAVAIFERNDNAFFQFLTPANKFSGFYFGDPDNAKAGELGYSHTADQFQIRFGGTLTFFFDDSGQAVIGLTSANANTLGIKAGTSTNDAAVGGVLYVTTTQTGNVGTGEDDLASYTVPANTLAVNNQSLWLEAWGKTANNANAKTLRVRFGGTELRSVTLSQDTYWHVRVRIVRTGAATQKVSLVISQHSNTVTVHYTTTALTLSSSQILKVTGEATSNDDIQIESFIVGWDDANT